MSIVALLLLVSLATLGGVAAQCSFEVDGYHFDLTAISTSDTCLANKPSSSHDIILNACVPVSQFSPPTVCTSGSALVCHKANNPATTSDQIIAKTIDTSTSTYDEASKTLVLYQTGGDYCSAFQTYRQTKITFTCDETATGTTSPVYVTESPACTYQLTWRTASACPVDNGSSGGSGSSESSGKGSSGTGLPFPLPGDDDENSDDYNHKLLYAGAIMGIFGGTVAFFALVFAGAYYAHILKQRRGSVLQNYYDNYINESRTNEREPQNDVGDEKTPQNDLEGEKTPLNK